MDKNRKRSNAGRSPQGGSRGATRRRTRTNVPPPEKPRSKHAQQQNHRKTKKRSKFFTFVIIACRCITIILRLFEYSLYACAVALCYYVLSYRLTSVEVRSVEMPRDFLISSLNDGISILALVAMAYMTHVIVTEIRIYVLELDGDVFFPKSLN